MNVRIVETVEVPAVPQAAGKNDKRRQSRGAQQNKPQSPPSQGTQGGTPPPLVTPQFTEDELAAGIVATILGTLNKGVKNKKAVAGYLLKAMPQEALAYPEVAAQAALMVARLTLTALPKPTGIVLPRAEDSDPSEPTLTASLSSLGPVTVTGIEEDVVDLAWSDGWFGKSAFARELAFRARYALEAAKRMARALLRDDNGAIVKERGYFDQHRRMQEHREQAWASLDGGRVRALRQAEGPRRRCRVGERWGLRTGFHLRGQSGYDIYITRPKSFSEIPRPRSRPGYFSL